MDKPKHRQLCKDCGGNGAVEWGTWCRPCAGKGYIEVDIVEAARPPEEVLSGQELINLDNWSASHKLDRLAEAGLDPKLVEYGRYLVRQGIVGEDE